MNEPRYEPRRIDAGVNGLRARSRQSGVSMYGILMLLVILAFGMNLGLTLGPHYMDNRSIVKVIEGLNPAIANGKSKKKIYAAIDKGLKVNSIRTLKSQEIVKIESTKGVNQLLMDYEIRENLFANLDVVLVFDKDFSY